MKNTSLSQLVDLMKVLAHPTRLRILALLRHGELCVCQIVDVLGSATSTASEHLAELRKIGLLAERKEGRWVFYALAPRPEWDPLVASLWPRMDDTEQIIQDRAALQAVQETPLETVCARSRGCAPRRPRHDA